MRESYRTAPTVSTHATLAPIGVKVHHLEIVARLIPQQDQPIGSDAEAAVAQPGDFFFGHSKLLVAIVDQNKVVARALVLVEVQS